MKRAAMDWELVRSRLRASEHVLNEALAETPDRIETAYRERAIRLARPDIAPEPAAARLPVLVFRLATELYAIELKELAEVLSFARCAPIPGAPPRFLGVINLRGELRPIVDLGRLLGCYENADRDSGFVLVIRRPGREIGLKVDNIDDLREIRARELMAPPNAKYAKGLTSSRLTLLDIDAVLLKIFSEEDS